MAGAGPVPKHPSTRARRNKTSTHAVLAAAPDVKVPPMPKGRRWHKEAVAWWNAVWSSPMRQEFDTSDERVLLRMLTLEDAYWRAVDEDDLRAQLAIIVEQRQQERRFGFTPEDRRRLQWQIEQAEQAEEKTTARRRKRAEESKPRAVPDDPRSMLA